MSMFSVDPVGGSVSSSDNHDDNINAFSAYYDLCIEYAIKCNNLPTFVSLLDSIIFWEDYCPDLSKYLKIALEYANISFVAYVLYAMFFYTCPSYKKLMSLDEQMKILSESSNLDKKEIDTLVREANEMNMKRSFCNNRLDDDVKRSDCSSQPSNDDTKLSSDIDENSFQCQCSLENKESVEVKSFLLSVIQKMQAGFDDEEFSDHIDSLRNTYED